MHPRARACLILLTLLVWGAVARSETLPVSAAAPKIKSRRTAEYTLWRDKDGIHLLWTDDGRKHTFAGTVKADGYITRLVQLGKRNQAWLNRTGANAFSYSMQSDGQVFGIVFHVIHAHNVTFDLLIDEEHANPAKIRIGPDLTHPKGNPFDIVVP